MFLLFLILLHVLVWLWDRLLILSGDVQANSGPRHNYNELLLKAHNSSHKFDIICVSETYLDSTVPLNDDNLVMSEYNWFLLTVGLIPNAEVSGSTIKTIYH